MNSLCSLLKEKIHKRKVRVVGGPGAPCGCKSPQAGPTGCPRLKQRGRAVCGGVEALPGRTDLTSEPGQAGRCNPKFFGACCPDTRWSRHIRYFFTLVQAKAAALTLKNNNGNQFAFSQKNNGGQFAFSQKNNGGQFAFSQKNNGGQFAFSQKNNGGQFAFP